MGIQRQSNISLRLIAGQERDGEGRIRIKEPANLALPREAAALIHPKIWELDARGHERWKIGVERRRIGDEGGKVEGGE